MVTLEWMETVFAWAGGLGALISLSILLYGIWRGMHRSTGRVTGSANRLLRKPLFFLLVSMGYFGLFYWMWQPLPLQLSPAARTLALALGGLAYFTGLALVMWGRLALGNLYYVSSVMGAQLFAGHRLVTSGPYALVRHPMYLGVMLTGLGGILLYRTWAMVFFMLSGFGLLLRARREEQALAAEFGRAWQDYCGRVPLFLPRILRGRNRKDG